MEECHFVIKPEAVKDKDEIEEKLMTTSLNVVFMIGVIMSKKTIKKLYSDQNKRVLELLLGQFVGKVCIIGLVRGENVIETLNEVSGRSYDPKMCTKGTIRYEFGNHLQGFEYMNAFHWPKTPKEKRLNDRILRCEYE